MKTPWIGVALLASALSCAALESADLLFHLSFENGVDAEFARGGVQQIGQPTELARRLVAGAVGRGYLCAGTNGTLLYYAGDKGKRGCVEQYGLRGNLFPDAGSLSFWIKALTNSNNRTRCYVRAWLPLQVVRTEYMANYYNYGPKGACFYDASLMVSPWHHIVMTWRKDEAKLYMNGSLGSTITDMGEGKNLCERIEIAMDSYANQSFQKKEPVDDTIMDEIQFFRRPLAPEEVQSLFERAQITTTQAVGQVEGGLVTRPSRAYAGHVLAAPMLAAPIVTDGALNDWKTVPAHGGFIERRVGILDPDDSTVQLASDAVTLYVAFRCPVDKALHDDPTHVMYPTGQFLAGVSARDGDLYNDDYLEVALKDKDGHVYRFAVNAKGTLLDSRDGDKSWNADVRFTSRSDFTDWTAELAIPLAAVGMAPADTVDFNVIRSWKLFKSSQSCLCADVQSQFGWGKLALGAAASASLESLGKPDRGALDVRGTIAGPAGDYAVTMCGQGSNQAFTNKTKVTVSTAGALTPFAIAHRLEKPGDVGVVVEVRDPAGKTILARSIPVVYVAASTVELINYPGWGKLDVSVVPLRAEGLQAVVTLDRSGKPVLSQAIPAFTNPAHVVRFETKALATGRYEVVTRLMKGNQLVSDNRQPYEKKPLPEWYDTKAGIIDAPPAPWTDVVIRKEWLMVNGLWGKWLTGRKTTVELLIKKISFQGTLFPSEIVVNGQSALTAPIRLRVKQNGKERVITTGDFQITVKTRRKASWQTVANDSDLQVKVNGDVEFDGFTWMTVTLAGGKVEHLSLEIPFRKEFAVFKLFDNDGRAVIGNKPTQSHPNWSNYWIGNDHAIFQYWWEHQAGWVLAGEAPSLTPTNTETVLSFPLIQKTTDLAKARTITLGWTLAPSKPLRANWRTIGLYRGVKISWADYSWKTPNYPQPLENHAYYTNIAARMKQPDSQIDCLYAFGPFAWNGSPEYAEWWREWRPSTAAMVRPDPKSTWLGLACHNSSSANLQLWRLERYVKQYPQRGIYFDCTGLSACNSEAHGCGVVDDNTNRVAFAALLADRRYYERVYNIMKAHDPVNGWVRQHDWVPGMLTAAFCDDNWIGEGYIGPLAGSPEKNYYSVVSLQDARIIFDGRRWGHLTSFLTELACTAGEDYEKRAGWYGKMVTPPKDGKPGHWTLPRWKDYEHVAGLGIVHDLWQVGGNDLQLPWMWIAEIERMMHWDDNVRFIGYWELGNTLKVEGAVPEKIVCSVYYRPAGLKPFAAPMLTGADRTNSSANFIVADNVKATLAKAGDSPKGWLILAPMNNTDTDVTLTLTPNLKALGFMNLANGAAMDIFRAWDFTWQGPPAWRANGGDPESPNITIPGKVETFAMKNGAVKVTVPKRSFRMLLLGVIGVSVVGSHRGLSHRKSSGSHRGQGWTLDISIKRCCMPQTLLSSTACCSSRLIALLTAAIFKSSGSGLDIRHFYQALLHAANVIILDGLLLEPTDRLADSGNLHPAGHFAQLVQG